VKLTYTGPHDEVEIPAAGVVAKRDKPVEISDELVVAVNVDDKGEPVQVRLVDSLLEQSVWEKAGGKAKEADA
jgi:hypothetical protein